MQNLVSTLRSDLARTVHSPPPMNLDFANDQRNIIGQMSAEVKKSVDCCCLPNILTEDILRHKILLPIELSQQQATCYQVLSRQQATC